MCVLRRQNSAVNLQTISINIWGISNQRLTSFTTSSSANEERDDESYYCLCRLVAVKEMKEGQCKDWRRWKMKNKIKNKKKQKAKKVATATYTTYYIVLYADAAIPSIRCLKSNLLFWEGVRRSATWWVAEVKAVPLQSFIAMTVGRSVSFHPLKLFEFMNTHTYV